MRRSPSARWLALMGVGALVFAALLAPPSASAGIFGSPIPNPLDAIKGLVGVPGEVASQLGATVLQEALEWLLGGLEATITLALVKFLVHIELAVGESLADLTAPIIVIGGFFLIVGLVTSIGDGYREVVAGTDTAPRVIGQAIFRVIGLALLLGSWFWLVPLSVDIANGMSGHVLGDEAVGSALRRTFASETLLQGGFPLLGLLTGIMLALAILALVVLKFVIAIAFAALYLGGPALIGFAALPRVGNLPLAIATRGVLTLTVIPLVWTVVFAAWAGVNAGMFESTSADDGGMVAGLMAPGLFLAGLVVMLGVTKKVLAMATLGVALSVPGAAVARSAVTMAVARGMGAAATGTAVAGAAERSTAPPEEHAFVPPVGKGGSAPDHAGPRTSVPTRSFRELDTAATHPRRETDRSVVRRQAGASISLFGATNHGVFQQPHHVREDAWENVSRQVTEHRSAGEPSVQEVLQAADRLPSVDRSGFGVLAKESLEQHPESAREIYTSNATRIVANRALQHTPEQREAGVTIAAARPEVVSAAFAPDYKAWGHGAEQESAGAPYDTRLMDQDTGLDHFRQDARTEPTAGRSRREEDEGLPF